METTTNPKELHRPRGTEFFSQQKVIKDALHSIHGLFLFGKIEGVDFTVEGSNDTMKWGNSLKLKFAQAIPSTKVLNAVSYQILIYKSQTIVIKADSKDELSQLVAEYSAKVGQNVVIELDIPPKDANYKALSINSY